MSNPKQAKEIAKRMAQLTISSNQINEVQQKNLKMYPFVFFNGVKSVKIEYDLTSHNRVSYETDPKKLDIKYKFDKPATDHFKVAYDLEIDETQDNSQLDKRCDAIEKSVRNLLWNEIRVEVTMNGKKVYPSAK